MWTADTGGNPTLTDWETCQPPFVSTTVSSPALSRLIFMSSFWLTGKNQIWRLKLGNKQLFLHQVAINKQQRDTVDWGSFTAGMSQVWFLVRLTVFQIQIYNFIYPHGAIEEAGSGTVARVVTYCMVTWSGCTLCSPYVQHCWVLSSLVH